MSICKSKAALPAVTESRLKNHFDIPVQGKEYRGKTHCWKTLVAKEGPDGHKGKFLQKRG
jgi:hypothetical protein